MRRTRASADAPVTSTVAVYGAGGHTGGFVLDELARRGIAAVAVARRAFAARSGAPVRIAAINDPVALARAFAGCAAVVNVAGPFLETAAMVIRAALDAGCHYLDVTAEQESAHRTLQDFDADARARGLAVIPAAGFYGGLADLLATALAAGAPADQPIDAIEVATALDRWWPTAGTRLTGARNTFPRKVVEAGRLVALPAPPTAHDRAFGPPWGELRVEQVPMSEVITIAHHLPVRRLRTFLAAAALDDLRDLATPPPRAVDALGRSPQRFRMEVELRDARGTHRASAGGRDIYAVSAPLVVEAASRLLRGAAVAGAHTLGSAFDAAGVLRALAPSPLALEGVDAQHGRAA